MTAIAKNSAVKKPFMLNFKDDTLTTVSRQTVKDIGAKLGFNKTKTVLFALAKLRDEVLIDKGKSTEDFEPITDAQYAVLEKASSKVHGKVLSTLLV